MDKLTRHRSILIHPKIRDLKLPSDVQGLTLIPYALGTDPIEERLEPVCDELKAVVARLGVRVHGKP